MTTTAGGGPAAMHTVLATKVGELTVVREGGSLTGLYFRGTGRGLTGRRSASAAMRDSRRRRASSASSSPGTEARSTFP